MSMRNTYRLSVIRKLRSKVNHKMPKAYTQKGFALPALLVRKNQFIESPTKCQVV